LGFGFGYKNFWVLGLGIKILGFGFGFGYNTQPNTQTQNPIFSGYKRLLRHMSWVLVGYGVWVWVVSESVGNFEANLK
jgi:hypothetical protein